MCGEDLFAKNKIKHFLSFSSLFCTKYVILTSKPNRTDFVANLIKTNYTAIQRITIIIHWSANESGASRNKITFKVNRFDVLLSGCQQTFLDREIKLKNLFRLPWQHATSYGRLLLLCYAYFALLSSTTFT